MTLQGDGKFELTQTKYRLTEEQKQDDGQKLFDFCVECLKTFVDSNTGDGPGMLKEGQILPLGFTVSDAFLDGLFEAMCQELIFDIRFVRPSTVLVSMHVSLDLILGSKLSECTSHDLIRYFDNPSPLPTYQPYELGPMTYGTYSYICFFLSFLVKTRTDRSW